MKKTKLLLALFFVASLFIRCNHDDSGSGTDDGPSDSDFEQNFGATASRDFIGEVVDMNNQPVQSATVKIGALSVQTDSNGIFVINGASVHQKFAYITANKTGYFEGSRAMVPTSGKNNVKIMLIPNAPIATVSSGQASEVTTDSGTKIIFDGSFQDENGAAYSGNVAVSVYHLSPWNANLDKLMPGMMYAERENGDEATLETFGMINVELRGAGGQKLQPAQDHPATIEVMLDAAQMANAPASIPLWHFDAAKGWWKEDGVATRQGNKYVGETSHFSWWNCDAPFPTVHFDVTVTNQDGSPVSNAPVFITMAGQNWPTLGYTNSNGQASGLIPSNAALTISVKDVCGNIVYTTTAGPYTADATLAITLPVSSVETATIQGTLLSCDGNNVTNGYILLRYAGVSQVAEVTNGDFSFTALVCTAGQTFTLQGADFDSLQQTDSISYTFQAPVTNVGNLQACSTVDEFISYQIDDEPTVFLIQEVNASLGSQGQTNGLSISGFNEGNTPTGFASLYIYSGSVSTPGTYTTAQFSLEGTLGYIFSGTTNDVVFTLTNVGAPGEYIDLTFSGTYVQEGETHTLSGVAHAIRN
ncbi:MAG: hypothetical protein EOO50_02135 [Flavobacterium sp.]|uniref:hypothetical protein n=1 Tax=Flavobacterium sp. TaxID=239 RepID=UPI001220923A|nr:hypothetical protein [Flavobacterium sp.]RZJ68240.1 MAG: hypothetical protein EOO50_02135 [Flavobacterium sp.]